MQVHFICACKNTRTNAPSGRITRNSSARGAHCARYNLDIYMESTLYYNHACPQNHLDSQNKQGLLANQNADSEYSV